MGWINLSDHYHRAVKIDIRALGEAGKKILIIKPSSLGDVIHTLPAVAALSKLVPGASITWLANTEWAPLLHGHPALERVIEFPRREFRGWGQTARAKQWARAVIGDLRPALAIDFQGLLRSALLARASGAEHIVGFTRSREGASQFYNDRVDINEWDQLHAVDRYLRLVTSLTAGHGRAEFGGNPAEPIFDLPAGEPIDCGDDSALEAVLAAQKFVVLHPFSRGRRKSLSSQEVIRFCKILAPQPVLIVGSDSREFSSLLPENAIDLLGRTTLQQLIWVLRRSRWTVSVDSGPMHLAAALSDRLLAIHTWSNPRVVGPCRKRAWVWRDGFLGRVGEIAVDQFPERRRQARELNRRVASGDPGDPDLLTVSAVDMIAEFVVDQLTSEMSQP